MVRFIALTLVSLLFLSFLVSCTFFIYDADDSDEKDDDSITIIIDHSSTLTGPSK